MVSASAPRRHLVWIAVASLFLLLVPGRPAAAEETLEPRQPVAVIDDVCLECSVSLVREWSYQPGDDPAWADPAFDDADWPLVDPALEDLDAIPGGWPGIGWFRRRIMIAESFGDHPLGLRVRQAGASEVYLDGRLVARFGTVSESAEEEQPMSPRYVSSLTLEPEVEYVLAVRYSNARANVFGRSFRGFTVIVGEIQQMTAQGLRWSRNYSAFMGGAMGLFGAFALLHLLLFAFRPKDVENLYFALFNSSIVALLFTELRLNAQDDTARALFLFKILATITLVMVLSGLMLELKVFRRKIGAGFLALVVLAAAVAGWTWTLPAFADLTPHGVVVIGVFLIMLWVAAVAIIRKEPEAWVIGLGFLLLTLVVLVSELRNFGLVELPWMVLPVIGLGSLVASFSIYLTRRMARTNQELEERLDQVEKLTAKTLQQERWAMRKEAERRLLEVDNRRKTEELAEARELQLEMLPKELPRLPGFDFAVRMTTANEVGGDYYDFVTDEAGGCTVAVGDATGHGLQAGMVVAVVKSLFRTASSEPRLSTVLQRIASGLETINRRAASMTMVLLRLEGRRMRIASAGMPPVLIWRQATNSLEEIVLPGAPLGTALANGEFQEHVVELERDDIALVMTDGLVEATDPDGDTLGYDRAARLFADSVHLEPEELIDHLVGQTWRFLDGTPLGDDMTLLVLKANGHQKSVAAA